ncbi:MAG: hypothetical protein MZU79_02425 [Anaerotruncus sp.]|nr:hypothetical protein [Anaerotruncus sp.]
MELLKRLTELIEEITAHESMELAHVEVQKEGGRFVLRVYLDKEGGITIEDCRLISKQIGYELDVQDIVPHAFVLEVSSPGIDRIMARRRTLHVSPGSRYIFP